MFNKELFFVIIQGLDHSLREIIYYQCRRKNQEGKMSDDHNPSIVKDT